VSLLTLALGWLRSTAISAVSLSQTKTEALGELVENIHVVINTTEQVLARTHSENGNVSKRVDTDALDGRQGTVDDETVGGILGVDEVLAGDALGGVAGALLVEVEVLAVVGVGGDTGGDGVAGGPVEGEVGAGVVADAGGLVGVLGETRVGVGADGAALLAVRALRGEVLGIGATEDAIGTGSLVMMSFFIHLKSECTYSKP
jgi:hypothetical protein